ncbi:MAG: L-2-hydroxyglutarate oxidase [Candidatus Omnitrophica bacterium]|nr:L-2-hydroxyglutarate oxidase [Candidatus Omnitrophota bacterium]
MSAKYNYILIGSGIIGLTLAKAIKSKWPDARILILDKEDHEAFHASSRNSGILHAGFYYTANSLKAQLTVKGSQAMKAFCREKSLKINECGKLVVARNEQELQTLLELEQRGKTNGSNIQIIDEGRAKEIEPNVKTFKKALWSPDTASIDPKEVCRTLVEDLKQKGIEFSYQTQYLANKSNTLITNRGEFEAERVINCAGLYADKIAQDFGFGQKYTVIPFKGLYLKYTKNKTDVKVNIYPVPNLKNPFLGVHFTKTVDGSIKIGPTAIPAFWKEQYSGLSRFKLNELFRISLEEANLFLNNSFGFRNLAFEELRKYNKKYFISLAQDMVESIDPNGFTEYTQPGIRAQLLNKTTRELVGDFIIEGDQKSLHILNAVSPAFTCSFAFAELVVKQYLS